MIKNKILKNSLISTAFAYEWQTTTNISLHEPRPQIHSRISSLTNKKNRENRIFRTAFKNIFDNADSPSIQIIRIDLAIPSISSDVMTSLQRRYLNYLNDLNHLSDLSTNRMDSRRNWPIWSVKKWIVQRIIVWKMQSNNKNVNKCCVLECDTLSGCGITLHKFPKETNVRNKWKNTIEAVNRSPLIITTRTFVCRQHFMKVDYNGRVLNDFAEPTVFKKWVYLVNYQYLFKCILRKLVNSFSKDFWMCYASLRNLNNVLIF